MRRLLLVIFVVCLLFSCKVYTNIQFNEDGSGVVDIRADYASYILQTANHGDTTRPLNANLRKEDYSYEKLSGKNFSDIRAVIETIEGISQISTKEIPLEGVDIHFEFANLSALKLAFINLSGEMNMMNEIDGPKVEKAIKTISFTGNKLTFLSYDPVQAEMDKKNVNLNGYDDNQTGLGDYGYDITIGFWKEVNSFRQRTATLSEDRKLIHFTLFSIYGAGAKDELNIVLK